MAKVDIKIDEENEKIKSIKIVSMEFSDEELARMKEKDSKPPSPNDFVKGGKYSWTLFKKRIKEFPFIKKQPRFKKYFYTIKKTTLKGEEWTYKYETTFRQYKKMGDELIRFMSDDDGIAKEAKILGCYWTCAKFIYHPERLEQHKVVDSKWYRTDLYKDSSYAPMKFIPMSFAENKKRKSIDGLYIFGGEIIFTKLITEIENYCLGLTDKKPDLTGYIIRK